MSTTDHVLTLQEVADLLRVHPNTVYRRAREGTIPAFKIGSDWRFHRASIEEWMRARHPGSPSSTSDDVFHVAYWLLTQGISLTVTGDEIGSLLDVSSRTAEREIRSLARLGYMRESAEGGTFALTPEGLEEARRRFGRERALPSGHSSVAEFASRQLIRS